MINVFLRDPVNKYAQQLMGPERDSKAEPLFFNNY